MKGPFLRYSIIVLFFVVLAACHKDDDATPNKVEFPSSFSDQTVEQNKQSLEDNGIALVDDITTLKNSTGIQASIAFEKHSSTLSDNIINGRVANNSGVHVLKLLSALGKGESSANKILKDLSQDEFVSIQDEFDNEVGIYTYNAGEDSWSYEKTGDKIVFKFPSTKTGTVNDAEYDIYGYKGVTISSNIGGDDYTGDYPAALKADLLVGGTKKMGFDFSASYNSKGDPSAVTISFSIDDFTITYALKNSVSSASVDYTLTKGSATLLAFGLSSTGDFDTNNTDSELGDIVTQGSAYFQIMNIKFSGKINTKTLSDELNAADGDQTKIAKALNDNYKLVVYYADSKKKIADSEFYPTTKTETYTECYWNDDLQANECEDVEDEIATIDIRLVFADGTKSDLSTYTDVGFQDLSDKLQSLSDDLDND